MVRIAYIVLRPFDRAGGGLFELWSRERCLMAEFAWKNCVKSGISGQNNLSKIVGFLAGNGVF